jgi:hypothetical protein
MESILDTVYRMERKYGPVEPIVRYSEQYWTLLLANTSAHKE